MRARSAPLLLRARSGAAALEFAIVSIPFLVLLLGTISVALSFYLQSALDYSLGQAVRQVQLGQVAATMDAGTFTATVFCPVFVKFAPCDGVLISMEPVADFTAGAVTNAKQGTSFCPGAPGQLMYARAVYRAPVLDSFLPAPTAFGPGSLGSAIVSAAAFANENPSGATIAGGSGC